MASPLARGRSESLIPLALSGVLIGGLLGALANCVNGWVSPLYFRNIMHWQDVQDIWRASVAQGILEGLLFGLACSVLFTAVVGIVSRARCPLAAALRYLGSIAAAAACCWVLGGLAAMGLAALSPEFYRHAFRGVPEDFAAMLRYAWVGGSIWGLQFGGLASVIVGSVMFRAWWRQQLEGQD